MDSQLLRINADVRTAVQAHAGATIDAILAQIRRSEFDSPVGNSQLSNEIGRSRASSQIHPAESLRAAALLYDVAAEVFVRELADGPEPLRAAPLALGVLSRGILDRSTTAAIAYMEYLVLRINTAQTDERRRVSRELHDRVAYGANSAFRSLELVDAYQETDPARAAEKLWMARTSLLDSLESLREIMAGLRAEVGQESLQGALQTYAYTVNQLKPVTWISVTGDELWIPPDAREEIFLALREALRNVYRHARAEKLEVKVNITPYEVRGTVIDDGVGFDPGKVSSSFRHVGLVSMRERIELLSGEVRVESAPDLGTRLLILVPLTGPA
ncbi:MAG: ATP-binding protein [Streptosporangiaceae bacterium]